MRLSRAVLGVRFHVEHWSLWVLVGLSLLVLPVHNQLLPPFVGDSSRMGAALFRSWVPVVLVMASSLLARPVLHPQGLGRALSHRQWWQQTLLAYGSTMLLPLLALGLGGLLVGLDADWGLGLTKWALVTLIATSVSRRQLGAEWYVLLSLGVLILEDRLTLAGFRSEGLLLVVLGVSFALQSPPKTHWARSKAETS